MLGFKSEFLKHFLSLDFTANIHLWFMWILSVLSAIVLAVFAVLTKKQTGKNMLKELNFTISLKKIARYFLLSCVLIVYAYLALATMKYFFHQDFRFWDNGMKDMLPQYWTLCLRYSLFVLPSFVVSAMMVNGGRMKDMGDGWNTLLQIWDRLRRVCLYRRRACTCYRLYLYLADADQPAGFRIHQQKTV